MPEKCAECGEDAELKCSACKLVAYCCKDHQKSHWKEHKKACRPVEVVRDEVKGQCLVATRDIPKGGLILSENPLVFGPRPHMVEEGPVPCPGCCRLIIGEESDRCDGCDFPICNRRCPGLRDMDRHAHECLILGLRDVKAINGLHDFYRQDTLLALRCLLLQNRHPKKFAQLLNLESHMDKRGEGTEIYKDIESRVADYFHSNFFQQVRMLEGKTGKEVMKDLSRETIHKICGIIDVNSLEINQDAEVSAIYPTACLMEHSCMPNTLHFFDSEENSYKITIKAAVDIKKGERISTMYTHALWGTQARREHLRETKYFSCSCKRCSDPTELGTYLSGLRCLNQVNDEQCNGIQLPRDPLNDNTEWACNKCDASVTNQEACFIMNQIGEEVDNVQLSNPTVRELDALLTKMLALLHPNHYHAYSVKHSLIQLYGYQQGYMPNQITDDCLVKKQVMCRELLDISRKIDPGNARLPLYTAVVLHELFLANMILIKRKWDLGVKTRVKSMLSLLKECNECLKEAKIVLENETHSPAGEKLISLIDQSCKDFARWIERNKIDLNQSIEQEEK